MKHLILILIPVFLFSSAGFAVDNASDNLTLPHSFSSGETISSSKMNENFEAIAEKINSETQIGNSETQNGKLTLQNPGEVTINFNQAFSNPPIVNVTTDFQSYCGISEIQNSNFSLKCYSIKESAGTGLVLTENSIGNPILLYWSATEIVNN